MDLNQMAVFVAVVDAGSFTGAGDQLGMPKSTVSRRLAELETRLGARLLERTTRNLRLTDVGRGYYERCRRIIDEATEADASVSDMMSEPRGLLRVAAPPNFAALGRVCAEYQRRYPDVRIQLRGGNQAVDLLADGIDVAIRTGTLPDSSFIARRLRSVDGIVVASPNYIARRSKPKGVDDLASHDCVLFTGSQSGALWVLQNGSGKRKRIELDGVLESDDFGVVHSAAIAGMGVTCLPRIVCQESVDQGHLVRLLPAWKTPSKDLHAIYPSRTHLPPKIRTFLDALTAALGDPA